MERKNVVDWHSSIAYDFDKKYVHNKAFIERFAVWTKIIDKYSNSQNHVLDIGCGSGILSFYLAERNENVVGIDGSQEMVEICETKKQKMNINNVIFLHHDIMKLEEILNTKADIIVCSSVLEYLDDLSSTLRLFSSFLKDKGVLILSMPNKSSLYRKLEPVAFKLFGYPRYYKYIKKTYTLKEASAELSTCGLSVLESAYYARTPIVSRVLRKIGLNKYSDNLFIIVAQL